MPINPSPAVVRACLVLDTLARSPEEPLSLAEISRRIEAPRATTDSVLLALAAAGYVVRDDALRYTLGSRGIALGTAARAANPAIRAASTEADELARRMSAFLAVATRDGDETWVADVFDFGPPFGMRTRPGQSIPLRPPFGAVFIAWDEPDGIGRWLDSESLTDAERRRYLAALQTVRDRGFSVTTAADRRPELMSALETLTSRPDAGDARRTRDEVMREMSHGEYLSAELDDGVETRVSQMSAPVFDRSGRVAAAIMLLGPNYEVTRRDIELLGGELVVAARRATEAAGGATQAAPA